MITFARNHARHATRTRRGVALVMFVLLVFAFLAIASVAIDLGMASMTQQEMQVAVDTAALEGLRLRDHDDYEFLSDQTRRPKVSQLVREVFDDNLTPTGVNQVPDALQLGAGPMMRITGGTGPLNANGTIDVPATPTWDDPILETNNAPGALAGKNKANGDMVSGLYIPGVAPSESAQYVRSDFVPSTVSGERWKALAFLVRMRRTTGANPLDNEPAVSMSGPTLPFTFGLGSLMKQADGSSYDPRHDGISVRATAIAVARPALRASAPARDPSGAAINNESSTGANSILGLYPFVLTVEFWTSVVMPGTWPSQTYDLMVQPDGRLVYATTGQVVGRFAQLATCVGQPVSSTAPVSIPTGQLSGFIALYADIAAPTGGTVQRVIGYCFADASSQTNKVSLKAGISAQPSTQTADVSVWVGANGVSARLDSSALPLSAPEWDQVFQQNKVLAYGGSNNPGGAVTYDFTRVRPGTLMAPALAR